MDEDIDAAQAMAAAEIINRITATASAGADPRLRLSFLTLPLTLTLTIPLAAPIGGSRSGGTAAQRRRLVCPDTHRVAKQTGLEPPPAGGEFEPK